MRLTFIAEGGVTPAWPQAWSDKLFVPAERGTQAIAERFLRWLASLGVAVTPWLDGLTSNPPPAKAGGVGYAYVIGDRIVKITPDSHEAKIATALAGTDVPGLTRFYGAVEVTGAGGVSAAGQTKHLYAIVQDRLPDKIPGRYRIAANAVYAYIDAHRQPLVNLAKAVQNVRDKFVPVHLRADPGVLSGVRQILGVIDAVYRRTGVMLQDPHAGNVLMRGHSVAMFDLGRSELNVKPPVAAL